MHMSANRIVAALGAAALALVLSAVVVGSAQAAEKSVQTEGEWVKYDAEAKTVTVKVTKPGRGDAAKVLKKGKEAVFAVKPEGSVLTRTTVAINGGKGERGDIPEGKTVNVFWRPDETDPTILRARKIDVILSDAELDEMYGTE